MDPNKQKLLHYLKSHELMVVATQRNRPTAATVYYGVDDNFNFYIVTSPFSEHGKNIAENNQVACVIVDTNQPMFNTKHKIGVQLNGTAKQLEGEEETKNALGIWSRRKRDVVEKFMKNITKNVWESRPFVIFPQEIKWFNEELYGEEGTEIFKF